MSQALSLSRAVGSPRLAVGQLVWLVFLLPAATTGCGGPTVEEIEHAKALPRQLTVSRVTTTPSTTVVVGDELEVAGTIELGDEDHSPPPLIVYIRKQDARKTIAGSAGITPTRDPIDSKLAHYQHRLKGPTTPGAYTVEVSAGNDVVDSTPITVVARGAAAQ